MAQLSSPTNGTCNVTNGSNVVSFDLLNPLTGGVEVGDKFIVVGGVGRYYIGSVSGSPQQVELTGNYLGTTQSGASFVIHRDFTPVLNLNSISKGDREQASLIDENFDILDGFYGGSPETLTLQTVDISQTNLEANVYLDSSPFDSLSLTTVGSPNGYIDLDINQSFYDYYSYTTNIITGGSPNTVIETDGSPATDINLYQTFNDNRTYPDYLVVDGSPLVPIPLASLSDVDITGTPPHGYSLTYNSFTTNWEPSPGGGSGSPFVAGGGGIGAAAGGLALQSWFSPVTGQESYYGIEDSIKPPNITFPVAGSPLVEVPVYFPPCRAQVGPPFADCSIGSPLTNSFTIPSGINYIAFYFQGITQQIGSPTYSTGEYNIILKKNGVNYRTLSGTNLLFIYISALLGSDSISSPPGYPILVTPGDVFELVMTCDKPITLQFNSCEVGIKGWF